MPAVTPAEVQTSPSRTKIGSGSTVDAGVLARQRGAPGPVRRRAAAVEQARRRASSEGAGADRRHAPGPRRRARAASGPPRRRRRAAARPRRRRRGACRSRRAAPAAAAAPSRRPLLERDVAAAGRDDGDLVRAGPPRAAAIRAAASKTSTGPDDVERLGAVDGEDADAHGGASSRTAAMAARTPTPRSRHRPARRSHMPSAPARR